MKFLKSIAARAAGQGRCGGAQSKQAVRKSQASAAPGRKRGFSGLQDTLQTINLKDLKKTFL